LAKSDSVIPAVRAERNGRYGFMVLTAVVAGTAAWFGVSQQGAEPVAESDPVPYLSVEYGYHVEFPGEPEEVSETETQAGIEIETTTVTWTGKDRAHSVSATAWPDAFPEGAVSEEVLLAALDAGADAMGGSVEDFAFVDLDGEPGIEGVVSRSGIDMRVVAAIRGDVMIWVQSFNGTVAQHEAFVGTFAFDD